MKKTNTIVLIVMLLCLTYSIVMRLLYIQGIVDVCNIITMVLSSFILGIWTRDSFEIRD